ncbi:MAG: ABC transporter ATP-binding protein [Proteobacteria bacterium]|nr:ABC transporter ATP-binding protein [Pseudomonadota bacterium]
MTRVVSPSTSKGLATRTKELASGQGRSSIGAGAGADVKVDRIEKRFGSHVAVQPTSFEVPAGKLVTLVGPSGSGKTTILKMIAGFEEPSGGCVLISGVDVTHIPAHKRNLGFVFQQYALFPHLTVAENVAYALKMRRVSRAEIRTRVSETLNLVRLDGLGERYPSQLSGGQQQRVAMARAIVFRPPLLLMDEPMSALDKRLRDEMQYEIRNLQQKLGITTIAVTHDQSEALVMSDVIVVLDRGAIEQSGPPQQVYKHPRSEFVATFLGESNILKGTVAFHEGKPWLAAGGVRRVPLVESDGFRDGDVVAYVVRPESITVASEKRDDAVTFVGRVVDTTFTGDAVRLRIDLGWSEPIVAKVLSRHGISLFQSGEEVAVSWSLADGTSIRC